MKLTSDMLTFDKTLTYKNPWNLLELVELNISADMLLSKMFKLLISTFDELPTNNKIP